jgi:poly [ADP-ribose] polymerase 10/14/15
MNLRRILSGVSFGNGSYFAADPAYSIRSYCPRDNQGLRYIYQVRVLTGKFAQGAAGMKEPPGLPNKPDANYDSVVDNVANPSMFVIFHDAQSYPEYLITFK